MQQYPEGNNPAGASDKGLNFNQLLFNAPNVNNRAQVARMDYNIDSAGKHTLMLRGTLNGAASTPSSGLAQFPGQAASQTTLDNSRGLAAAYTAILTPHLINVLNHGYTRLGVASAGTETVLPSFGFTTLSPTSRPAGRISPTNVFTDDLTWSRGRHSVQAGVSFRINANVSVAGTNLPSYAFSRNTLLGLGPISPET
jgi:hypothetical protein